MLVFLIGDSTSQVSDLGEKVVSAGLNVEPFGSRTPVPNREPATIPVAEDASLIDEPLIDLVGLELRNDPLSLPDVLSNVHPEDHSDLQNEIQLALTRGVSFKRDFRNVGSNGSIRFLRIRGAGHAPAEAAHRLFCVLEDVTDLRDRIHDAELGSAIDPLTGLGNQRFLSERGKLLLDESSESSECIAVLYLDIDGFKALNDSLGHEISDLALMTLSSRLIRALRRSDLVCRELGNTSEGAVVSKLGGDEFTAMLPGLIDPNQVLAIATRIQAQLAQPMEVAGHELSLQTSCGIALFPEHGESLEELLSHAHMALYDAKRLGRSQSRLYSPSSILATTDASEPNPAYTRRLREASWSWSSSPASTSRRRRSSRWKPSSWAGPTLTSGSCNLWRRYARQRWQHSCPGSVAGCNNEPSPRWHQYPHSRAQA